MAERDDGRFGGGGGGGIRGDRFPGIFQRHAGSPASAARWRIGSTRFCCWPCCRPWRARKGSPTWRGSDRRSCPFCGAFFPSPTARRATTIWATSSPRSTPQAFRQRFLCWVGALTKAPLDVIAIDGKTLRRSGRKGGEGTDPHGVGLRGAPAPRTGAGQGEREVERDRRNPRPSRHVVNRGRRRHHRRHGLPARHRPEDHRQEGRLRPGPEGQPGHAARRRRVAHKRAETKGFRRHHGQRRQDRRRRPRPIETRNVTVIHDVAWLQERHQWPGLKGVVIVDIHTRNRRQRPNAKRAFTSPLQP